MNVVRLKNLNLNLVLAVIGVGVQHQLNKIMTNKKITTLTTLIWLTALMFLFITCSPKTNCGTKKQHKARQGNTKRMAPSMAN
tara:strand:+ start:262 stop:510 length:249 start_codon:yes stop_codon:yes gene_type:complete